MLSALTSTVNTGYNRNMKVDLDLSELDKMSIDDMKKSIDDMKNFILNKLSGKKKEKEAPAKKRKKKKKKKSIRKNLNPVFQNQPQRTVQMCSTYFR